jgi:phage tail protein X
MYYNSNQNSNEYYSSYKQELSAIEPTRRDKTALSLPLKVGMGILLLGFIGLGTSYLVKYFSTDKEENVQTFSLNTKDTTVSSTTKNILEEKNSKTDEIPKIVIIEDQLPKSVQIQDAESKIIAHIKQNATDSLAYDLPTKSKEHNEIKKEVISLTETSNLNATDIENIVNIILSKKKEQNSSSLEKELLDAEQVENKTKTLKETNHYNKVVLSEKDESTANGLIKLNNDFEKVHKKVKRSKYEKSLRPEIATRSNAMRIIVVKKGDTLSKLAKKAYGDKLAYDKIFKANPEIIKNPNQIYVGQKIRIPL